MTVRKRALGALAAGALVVPLFASPASANHIQERSIDQACPADEVTSDQFTDVKDGDVFARAINCIAEYGVATGFVDGEYKPRRDVTRQQMAQFIFRVGILAGADFDTTTDPGYPDDPTAPSEQRDAIWGLTNAGVVRGFSDGRFGPGENIQRQQMASFIANLQTFLQVPGFGPATRDFFDDDNGTTHESKINLIAEEGITVGQGSDRRYGILGFVTRGQMAQFLARKIDILVEKGLVTPLGEQGINVKPDTRLEDCTAIANPEPGEGDPADNRQYTATGLLEGEEYRITLVEESTVTRNASGELVFTEDGNTGLANPGTTTADIVEVEGAAPRNNTGDGTATTPNNVSDSRTAVGIAGGDRQITFTVDVDEDPTAFFPIVYRNGGGNNTAEEGGSSPRLELNDDNTAAEPVDDGGVVDCAGGQPPPPPPPANSADVTVDQQTVTAGDNITGDILGSNIDSARVRGTCVLDGEQLLTDQSTEAGLQFSFPTDQNAAAGECRLEFVTTFEDGTTETEIVTVTIERQQQATTTGTTTGTGTGTGTGSGTGSASGSGLFAGVNNLLDDAAGFLADLF